MHAPIGRAGRIYAGLHARSSRLEISIFLYLLQAKWLCPARSWPCTGYIDILGLCEPVIFLGKSFEEEKILVLPRSNEVLIYLFTNRASVLKNFFAINFKWLLAKVQANSSSNSCWILKKEKELLYKPRKLSVKNLSSLEWRTLKKIDRLARRGGLIAYGNCGYLPLAQREKSQKLNREEVKKKPSPFFGPGWKLTPG